MSAKRAADSRSTGTDAVAGIVGQWRRECPGLDPTPMLVVGRIGRLADTLDRRLRPPFAAAGLGNGDFDVLAALRRAGDPYALTPGELSRAMLVTTGAVTKRVDRLESRGLVTREVAADDARGRLVSLTPEGVRLTGRLMEQHLANERALLAGLGEEDRELLGVLLGRLASSLEESEEGTQGEKSTQGEKGAQGAG